MPNKRQLLQDLKGEKVTIYTVEKEFTGTLRKFGSEFSVSHFTTNSAEIITITPRDIVDIKRLSMRPIIFMHNHFSF
jgi:hypothetical protein